MVRIKMSEEELEKIKKESNLVEKNGEISHPTSGNDVEPIAMLEGEHKHVGKMQAAPAIEPRKKTPKEGYDATKHEESFEERHPKIAKAIDIGKTVAGKVGEFVEEEMIHHGAEERKKPTEEEKKEEKKKKQKELSRIEKEIQDDFLGDGKKSKKKKEYDDFWGDGKKSKKKKKYDDDEDDDNEDYKSSSKQKILSRNYEAAYKGQGGLFGSRGYDAAYTSKLGTGSYQPAYKTTVRETPTEEPKRSVKSAVEEMSPRVPQPTQPIQPPQKEPDRFNTQNWQSLGFPNTLPQSARGSLFRPAPQRPVVVPMVQQPYQPRMVVQQRQQMPIPSQTRQIVATPMPRIGLSLNMPQMMKPRVVVPPRAPQQKVAQTSLAPPQMTFMGVNFNEKKKQEPKKPLTRIGEGYKNVPLTLMNGLYPFNGYNPNKDPITKKSIIPKIGATISTNDLTMFGMKVKNKKI